MSKQSSYIVAVAALLFVARLDAQTEMPALEAEFEFSYTLPNGQQLKRNGHIYRSASGKMRQDTGLGSMIADLEAGTVTMLIPDTKQARVITMPPELRTPSVLGNGSPVFGIDNGLPARVQPFEETTINGHPIAKTRVTGPRGEIQEVWTATDLGVVTFARVEANGLTTTQELRNLSIGEPDPQVFEVPSDYTVIQEPTRLDTLSRASAGRDNPLGRATMLPPPPGLPAGGPPAAPPGR